MLDVVVPLVSSFVPCACFLAPKDYITCAPAPRVQWLRRMQTSCRMHVIIGSAKQPVTDQQRCFVWLCVFSCPAIKNLLLHEHYKTGSSLSFVVC